MRDPCRRTRHWESIDLGHWGGSSWAEGEGKLEPRSLWVGWGEEAAQGILRKGTRRNALESSGS